MPFLLLLVLALTIGFVVGVVVWRYPRIQGTPPAPTLAAARKVGKAAGRHPNLRAVLDARLNPAAATGLALTLALVFVIGGGVLLGVLAYLVRTNSHLIGVDNSVAKWGNSHASATSTHLLNAVTQLGSIYTVIVLCVVLAVVQTIRERSVWVIAFIVAVIGGEEILMRNDQAARRPCAPDLQSRRCDARAGVPQRPLGDGSCFLRYCGASTRLAARSSGASGAGGSRGGDRRRGRREPRAAGRALADGRDRRSFARLGLVRSVRNRLRRPDPPLRRRGRDSRAGRGRHGSRPGRLRRFSGKWGREYSEPPANPRLSQAQVGTGVGTVRARLSRRIGEQSLVGEHSGEGDHPSILSCATTRLKPARPQSALSSRRFRGVEHRAAAASHTITDSNMN